MLHAKVRYAVMSVIDIALNERDNAVNLSNISTRQNIPQNYSEHILTSLKNSSLLTSVKGPGGGYRLTSSAKKITLLDILSALNEPIKLVRCTNDKTCLKDSRTHCLAHIVWKNLEKRIIEYFSTLSIEKIVEQSCIDKSVSRVYADHNAATFIDQAAQERMIEVLQHAYNPSASHTFGQEGKSILERARQTIREVFNAPQARVIFTSSGTEANNLVLKGLPQCTQIVSAIEHVSVLRAAITPHIIKVDNNGIIVLEHLREILKSSTAKPLVSVMLANNETGVIQPLQKIADLVHEFRGILHTDAAQACGKIPVDFTTLHADILTFSAHKFGGSPGVGVVIYRDDRVSLQPFIHGGGQEHGIRAGTENLPAIAAMEVAVQNISAYLAKMDHVTSLRQYLETEISNHSTRAQVFSHKAERLPNTTCLATKGINNAIQVMHFDSNDICISSSAACASLMQPNHVLLAMGMDEETAQSSIRISLGSSNTLSDIEKIIQCWKNLQDD